MTVKFFGGERANLGYLLRNPTAKVLRGAPEITSKIIGSLDFIQRFCSGCLSFNESLSDSKIDQHIAEFESLIRTGLPNESVNSTWILHRDKGRDELHFIFPQVDLITERQLTIYLDRLDREVVNAFRDRVNIREGYTRPDDPKRKKMTSIPFRAGATKKEFIAQIGEAIHQQVEAGNVSNRDQVVNYLEKQGLQIKRGKKGQLPLEYLKIKRKEDEKFTGLRGAYYRVDFVSRDTLKADLPSISTQEALKIAEEKLQKGIEQRGFRQAKRHETALRAAQKRRSHVLSPLAPKTAPEITLDAEMKPLPMAQQVAIGVAPEIQNYEAQRTTSPFSAIVDGTSRLLKKSESQK